MYHRSRLTEEVSTDYEDSQPLFESVELQTGMGYIVEAIVSYAGEITISIYSCTADDVRGGAIAKASTTAQRLIDGDMLLDPTNDP